MSLCARARIGQPFLYITGIYSPHLLWVAPQRYFDLYDPASNEHPLRLPIFLSEIEQQRRSDRFSDQELHLARQGYYGQISEVDHHVGRMLDALADLDIAEETIGPAGAFEQKPTVTRVNAGANLGLFALFSAPF